MKGNIDVDLINRIVNDYSDMILRIAYQRTQNLFDAQDIAQEVFVALMKSDIFRMKENELKAYIIRTAVNKCNDLHRRKNRRRIVSLEDAEPVFAPEEKRTLDEVNSLPEKYRIVVYLRYYEGYSVNEIAEILGRKPSAISSRLNRARAMLKKLLTEE